MNHRRAVPLIILLVLLVLALSACGTPQQGRAQEAIDAVAVPDKSNFEERAQIAETEMHLDNPGRIYFVHLLTDDGRLINTWTCKGRPNSSTESLEPNIMYPRYSTVSNELGFLIELEGGQMGYSPEAMGMDGTYGDPVAYRYCMTTDGHYMDFSPAWRYLVTDDASVTFPDPVAEINTEMEAKKLIAEQAIKQGKCVNTNLDVAPCAEGTEYQAPEPSPTETADGFGDE